MKIRTAWIGLLFLMLPVMILLSCSSSSTEPPVEEPPMIDALEDYWADTEGCTSLLIGLGAEMDAIENAIALLGSDRSDNDDIAAMVEQYLADSQAAAAKFDDLIDLEDSIHGYGNDRGIFTDTASAVARGLLSAAKKTVVSSGQMVRTSWRVLSGSHSLRQALSATDSGIPIVSDMAKRLQEHNTQRDDAIVAAILAGDTQEGYVPIGELQGSTPEERANYYRNLSDDSAIKKDTRGHVHYWHSGERAAIAETMRKAGQDGVKTYAGAVSGSEALVEVGDQLTSPNQDPAAKGAIAIDIKRAVDASSVAASKTMIIQKRNQPEDEPKIVILDGVDADVDAALPEGTFDIMVIAEDYIRAIQPALEVAISTTTNALMEMYEYADNAVVLESISSSPEVCVVDERVTVSAIAASTIDGGLDFAWEITGGGYTGFATGTAACSFTPVEAADYTVNLTVTGATGVVKTGSTVVTVTPVDIQVSAFDFSGEQIADDAPNPGETLSIDIDVLNSTDSPITGTVVLIGQRGITLSNANQSGFTVPAQGTLTAMSGIHLPVDYSESTGTVEFRFISGGYTISQELIFDVEFYAEIDPISSPVTDRVLTITGMVANPDLNSASLVLDGDIDQVFEVNLTNGEFSQDIAVPSSASSESHTARLTADSGSWREEDTATFTSQVAPAGFRVTMTWDTSGTDVDLWVTDPNGEKCYYGNTTTGLGLHLDFDDTDGYGPENITTGDPAPGAYLVQAHYWDDNDDEAANPTSVNIVIRLNEGTPEETVLNYGGGLGETDDVWTVTTINIEPDGAAHFSGVEKVERIRALTLPPK
ncbi:MAG: DUF2135 domain-containing protein [bacterium]|nr:DUF2135 domain-containing protein [bacterium]